MAKAMLLNHAEKTTYMKHTEKPTFWKTSLPL